VMRAIRSAVEGGQFDEIIISSLPKRVSRWLRRDLPSQVKQFGLPLTVVTSSELEHRGGRAYFHPAPSASATALRKSQHRIATELGPLGSARGAFRPSR